jgi:hypothetical protein
MISISFSSEENKAAFLAASGLAANTDGTVTIPMSLIPLATAKQATVTQADQSIHRFLVKTNNIAGVQTPVTVVTSEGDSGVFTANGQSYYLVETQQGLDLYNELNGNVEQVDAPVKLLSEINSTVYSSLPAEDGQWARLRLVSRTRPLLTEFQLAQTSFTRKPNVVVIDSGINFAHSELAGLDTEHLFALSAFNGNTADESGHGTAVASLIAGSNIGVHRHLKLLSCKVFNKTYKPNAIELGQALDACYNRYIQDPTVPMVVNCSWGVAKNSYLEGKFQDLISAGIAVVAAAGNSGVDVAYLTPAGMTDVITVAASDKDDIAAGFNNFSVADFAITTNTGLQVDIFAPGVDVYIADYRSNADYAKASGTSFSAGFVSGAVAAILALVPNSYRESAANALSMYSNKGVLLLDPERFTTEQNQLAYLITAENQTSFSDSSFYLGAFDSPENQSIAGNISAVLNPHTYGTATGEIFNYIVTWADTANAAALNAAFTIDSEGKFILTNPALAWQPDEKLRLVSFKVAAESQSGSIKFSSPELIFFAVNPAVTESLTGDISTALENIDNQSFFAFWYGGLIK